MSSVRHHVTLKNKVVIITGAAQGIGAGIAKKFAENNFFVVLIDINYEQGKSQEEKLNNLGYKAKFYPCDLSNLQQVQELARLLSHDFETIDVIINNAKGITKEKDNLLNLTLEWDAAFKVMLKHPIILFELLLDNLKKSENASIINIGSTNAQFISSQPLAYHVIKGSLYQATRYLACSYGAYKIRVNLLHPGIVQIPERIKNLNAMHQKTLEHVIPLQRAASVEEVGDCCLFLSSSAAKYITGTEMTLDGGEHLKDHFQLAYSSFKQQEEQKLVSV